MSMGNLTTSCRFSITKSMHSCTSPFISKKSLDIRIEITFFISSFGPIAPSSVVVTVADCPEDEPGLSEPF